MNIPFPRDSIKYMAICIVGIVLFVFLGLVPAQRSITRLDGDIAGAKLRIEEQKTLSPLYKELKERAEKKSVWALPFPARSELPREELKELTENIKRIAGKYKVDITSIMPALGFLADKSETLLLELAARGDFFSFRKFLIDLEGIPFVKHVEEIQIQQQRGGMELKIKLWISSR